MLKNKGFVGQKSEVRFWWSFVEDVRTLYDQGKLANLIILMNLVPTRDREDWVSDIPIKYFPTNDDWAGPTISY
jgi:hypothetical protein